MIGALGLGLRRQEKAAESLAWINYLAQAVEQELKRNEETERQQPLTSEPGLSHTLEERERRFRSLIEKSWDAVAVVDSQGLVSYASPTTTRILGYELAEFVGCNAFERLHPDDLDRVRTLFHQLLSQTGGSVSTEYRYRHKDGSWRWLEAIGTNLLADPILQGVVVNYHDITDLKNLSSELCRRMEELSRADRRKDEFLAVLAHELRSPLAPVRHGLQIIKQLGREDTPVDKVRAIMERQVHHLTRLVDDLLDVARITHGRLELRKETVVLSTVVNEAVELCRPLIDSRQHELTVSLPPSSCRLEADPARLTQILTNLLDNAAQYTEPGGQIWLTVEQEGQEVVFRVRDTGRGIPSALLPRLFEPFEQAGRENDSLGIGLTLVERLVRLHGGRVQAFSPGPGQGCEFVIRLAGALDNPSPAEPGEGGQRVLPATIAPKRSILVVDDDVDTVKSLAMLLRLEGHEVRVAYNGPKAVEIAQQEAPDIILLDLGMPEMDGFQVAQQLRQQPALGNALLVAMTGYGQEEDRWRSRAAGFDYHLLKPVEPEALNKLLAQGKLSAYQSG